MVNPLSQVESFLGPEKNSASILPKYNLLTLLNSNVLTELIPFTNLPYDFRHALATGSDREKHHSISNPEDVDEQQDTESKVDVLKHDIEKLLLSAANRKSKTVSSKKKMRAQGDSTSFQILGDDDEDVADDHVDDQSGSDHTNTASATEETNRSLEVTNSQGVDEQGEEAGDEHASQAESPSQAETSQETETNGIDRTVQDHSTEKPSSLEQEEGAHHAIPDIEEIDEENDATVTKAGPAEDEPLST